jgi:hypothetical protein
LAPPLVTVTQEVSMHAQTTTVAIFALGGVLLTALPAARIAAQTPSSPQTQAQPQAPNCPVTHERLVDALRKSVKPSGGPDNGGLENNEWAAIVSRDGTVCAVAFSGNNWGDQWLGSRAIAAEKANTANAFSLDKMALSTANLYAGTQPGGFLFGLGRTDPPRSSDIGDGAAAQFGTDSDPLLGKKLGGIVVFGGGLALYGDTGLVGGLGVSGDTSCADHNVAWRMRDLLGLNHVTAGVNTKVKDGIVYDIGLTGSSSSGFGHPKCKGREADIASNIGAGTVEGLLH